MKKNRNMEIKNILTISKTLIKLDLTHAIWFFSKPLAQTYNKISIVGISSPPQPTQAPAQAHARAQATVKAYILCELYRFLFLVFFLLLFFVLLVQYVVCFVCNYMLLHLVVQL